MRSARSSGFFSPANTILVPAAGQGLRATSAHSGQSEAAAHGVARHEKGQA